MKCPSCRRDQKAREGMVCRSCGYRHVLNPKVDGTTDGRFLALVRAASVNDTRWFTSAQLYATYCRRSGPAVVGAAGCASLIVGMFATGLLGGGVLDVLGGGVAGYWMAGAAILSFLVAALLAVRAWTAPPARRSSEPVFRWMSKWEQARGPLEKLLREPGLGQSPGPYREPDVYDYGAERVLIVERPILVDLLVRNGFHAEQRVLVLAENGYPQYLQDAARRLLEARSDLPVFVLHDSTVQGVAMASRLRASPIFPVAARRIIDAGLSTDDVKRLAILKRLAPAADRHAVPVDYLPYSHLSRGLAGAFAAYGPLAAVLVQDASRDGDTTTSDFG